MRGGRSLSAFALQEQAINRSRVTSGSITPFFAGERPILGQSGWARPEIGGTRMMAGVACRSCGTGLRENAKFCDECGAPTAISVDTAEYKQVTVLFADVVRSMDIAAALDMERLREVMTESVERSAAVVRRYGGTVEYTGDGVMAIFGAPSGVGGPRFSGMPGRAGHPGGGEPVGGRGGAPRRCRSSSAGGPEFGSGDRR